MMNPNSETALPGRLIIPAVLCQALFGLNHLILLTLGMLSAQYILPVEQHHYAAFPAGSALLASFIFTGFAGRILKHQGFRIGFLIAGCCGIAGALLFCSALLTNNFYYLIGAGLMLGAYQSFAGFLRFAAADMSPCCSKGTAIGAALGGGLLAALVAPFFIEYTKELALPVLYLGVFAVLAAVNIVGLAAPMFLPAGMLNIEKTEENPLADVERSLKELMRNPRFMIATYCAFAAQSAMHFISVAAPAAMVGCGLGVGAAAFGIQTHAIAMFGPALFTGKIIRKLGKSNTLILGFGLLIAALPVAVRADDLESAFLFQAALLLLGVGWNFTFIAASVLLTTCYCPCERTKVQAAHDTMIYGGSGLSVFFAGAAFEYGGWDMILTLALPVLCAGLALAFKVKEKDDAAEEKA